MRRIAYAALMLMGVLTIAGCAKVDELFNGRTEKITFVASFADETRTSYQGEGKVDWVEGDSIWYYTKKGGPIGEYEVVRSGHSTNVVADVVSGTSYIIAAYGGTGITDNTVTSFTLNGVVKAEQSGKFEDAHVSVAKGFDIEDGASLTFHNMTSLIKFALERTDVSYITFTANGGEKIHGNGTLKVTFSDDVPTVVFGEEGESTIRVNTNGAGTFYIATLQEELQQGFSIKYFDSTNCQIGETYVNKVISISSNEILDLGYLDSRIITRNDYPEPVDMGLSVKWGQCNVGTIEPHGYGDFYAWGEVETYYQGIDPRSYELTWKSGKQGYGWTSYKWCNGSYNTLTKYNRFDWDGLVDNKDILELEDDVANSKLGEDWRMPTDAEWKELLDANNCTWSYTTMNEVRGYKVTSKITGESIFLPAAGSPMGDWVCNRDYLPMGFYWTSTLKRNYKYVAWSITFNSRGEISFESQDRPCGYSVRPVYGKLIHVSGVKMNKKIATMYKDSTLSLSCEVLPLNASENGVIWYSSDQDIATVDNNGFVKAKAQGTVTITVETLDGRYRDSCTLTIDNNNLPVEAVDLGLSVKWATCNLGAKAPEEYGDYYAWGDIETYYEEGYAQENPQKHWKSSKAGGYSDINYKFYNTEKETGSDGFDLEYKGYTKYVTKSKAEQYGFKGFYDDKRVLDPDDDVAHIKLGGKWRMPTYDEFIELQNNCTWQWATYKGVNGYKVTSNVAGYTDKWIFLPAAGCRGTTRLDSVGSLGSYWSSLLLTNLSNSAFDLDLDSNKVSCTAGTIRYVGQSIRPVSD